MSLFTSRLTFAVFDAELGRPEFRSEPASFQPSVLFLALASDLVERLERRRELAMVRAQLHSPVHGAN